MDLLLSWINAAACGLISLALVGAILSPKVHDGIVIKIGLICLAAGFGAIALLMIDGITPDRVSSFERALLLINAGLTLVIIGYLLRRSRMTHPARRVTDWTDLADAEDAARGAS